MKKLILLSAFFIFASLNISAQTAQSGVPSPAGGAVLNGKAISLPKPVYPSAAKAVKAGGSVSVQVLLDEQGNVVSAAAVSGHPLLRAAAVQAAREAKFSPTTLSGQAVKVTGTILYNFTPDPVIKSYLGNWYQTGMSLSALESMPTLKYFEPLSLAMMIPSDWTAEREQITRLDELKKDEAEAANGDAPKERVIDERTVKNGDNKNSVKTTTMAVTVAPDRKVSSETTAIAQSLISSIQGRLASNELDLWYFNLGINVNRGLLNADSRDESKRLGGAKSFREFIKNPPAEISENVINDLQKMAAMMEKGIFTDEDKVAFTQLMMRLNTLSQN